MSSSSSVETDQGGEQARRATAVLHAAEDDDSRRRYDIAALLAEHIRDAEDGDELRKWLRRAWASSTVRRSPVWPRVHRVEGERAIDTVLAEVGAAQLDPLAAERLPRASGAAGRLLPVRRRASRGRRLGDGRAGVAVGCAPAALLRSARNAQYCYSRVTRVEPSAIEADLELLDEHGAVLLTVRGLRCGTGSPRAADRDGYWASGC